MSKIKDKALEQIEQLCLLWQCSPKKIEDAQRVIDKIYKFAHCVQEKHSCHNHHENWRKELEESKLIV